MAVLGPDAARAPRAFFSDADQALFPAASAPRSRPIPREALPGRANGLRSRYAATSPLRQAPPARSSIRTE